MIFKIYSCPVALFASIFNSFEAGIVDAIPIFNPLSPHDALKHHFTSLKTHLILLQLRVVEGKFP